MGPSPTSAASRFRRIAARLAAVVGLLFATGAVNVDFDELDCEAALAHLAECCPSFSPRHHLCARDGCAEAGRLPDLAEAESRCIIALDCADIVARSLCEAVDRQPANTFDDCPNTRGCGGCPSTGGPTLYVVHPPVCP